MTSRAATPRWSTGSSRSSAATSPSSSTGSSARSRARQKSASRSGSAVEAELLRDTARTWRVRGSTVEIADATFTPTLIDGTVDDVRWQLTAVPGAARFDPVPPPARRTHPFDLELVSRPRARFSGTVQVAGETFQLRDARGTLNHYWGRRLPASWVWVSADLDDSDIIVEAVLLRSRLWKVPKATVMGGYVVLDGGGRNTQVLAPAYGRLSGDR